MITESKFGKTEDINGQKFTKLRGGRGGLVMRDRTKYNRKNKHRRNREW